jgi:hypothetical protein
MPKVTRRIEYWVTYFTSEYTEGGSEEEHCYEKFNTEEEAEDYALNFDSKVEDNKRRHLFIRKVFVRD